MKQLKHRFKRWGVKKYINDADMVIMLSLQQSHQLAGQDVRFECKGHLVEPERLQRALRRRREPLIPPTCGYCDLYTIVDNGISDTLY